jgi:oxamate amidohydrolase
MIVAPHHLAAEAGLSVLKEGGNAIEAMVAAASTIAVVYPHMNGIGGDGFWLIGRAGTPPIGIQACGRAALGASRDWYRGQGAATIPSRGPLAALTMAGTVDGWAMALEMSRTRFGGRLSVPRLLQDAIHYAREGAPVTRTLHTNAAKKLAELRDVPGFAELHLDGGNPRPVGSRLHQPKLAATLERLAEAGFADFYHGDLARSMAADLKQVGSPLRLVDFERRSAVEVVPLSVEVTGHKLFNLPPPTQGLASLLILALYARNPAAVADGPDHLHRLVEASKAAFRIRNRYVTDPAYMERSATAFSRRA